MRMRICAIVKYPPIQGGVSVRSYWIARSLAQSGHQVHIVTNADQVEEQYRVWFPRGERERLECSFSNGGQVRVSSTWSINRRSALQVPASDMYVTKLASLAADTVRSQKCDIIYSYYLEPYCVAGHLASGWTDVPHVIEHAGSDRTTLLSNPELSTAYKEVLRAARGVISVPGTIENLGVASHRVHKVVSGFLPDNWGQASDRDVSIDSIISELGLIH